MTVYRSGDGEKGLLSSSVSGYQPNKFSGRREPLESTTFPQISADFSADEPRRLKPREHSTTKPTILLQESPCVLELSSGSPYVRVGEQKNRPRRVPYLVTSAFVCTCVYTIVCHTRTVARGRGAKRSLRYLTEVKIERNGTVEKAYRSEE